MSHLELEIWSDIACPWCYVGKRRMEAALRRFGHAEQVKVTFRAFELDPSAPKELERNVSHAARIARKYGMSVAQAERATQHLVEVGRGEGLSFDFVNIRSGNTFDAHRLVHLGREHGLQDAVKERFLKAYFEQGALMSDPETLVRLATEAGVDAGEVADVLASDAFGAAVRAEEAQAHEFGISGVPCFVFDRRLAVSGAQSCDVMLSALEKAWSERSPAPVLVEGAVCGRDGAGC